MEEQRASYILCVCGVSTYFKKNYLILLTLKIFKKSLTSLLEFLHKLKEKTQYSLNLDKFSRTASCKQCSERKS